MVLPTHRPPNNRPPNNRPPNNRPPNTGAGWPCGACFPRLASPASANGANSLTQERAMFKGSLVALITPMREDGSVDEKAYAEFVDWQIKEGTHGVVPV